MTKSPICFAGSPSDGRLHPVDEKAFTLFALEMYKRYLRLAPGRHFEFVGSRDKGGNQRIDGHFVERSYPLHDDPQETLDFRVTLSVEVSPLPGPE